MAKAPDRRARLQAAQAALPPPKAKPTRTPQGNLSFAAAVQLAYERRFYVIRRARRPDGSPEVRFLNVDRETHRIYVTGVGPDWHHVTLEDISADNWQESM